ncbi:MAG: hypothetical protein HQL23_06410 [Candidatus Omnitrophica bacterium]|nr:hypothetical protein [Candidatus Omnitrophota bacterium]
MEKNQYDLCLEVFRRFHEEDILKDVMVIGSWSLFFYEKYFQDTRYLSNYTLRTRDLDFLIDKPRHIKKSVDIPELLKNLGFAVTFHGSEGYIKLNHPDLILEFLVPEMGRGTSHPFPLPQFKMNAVALRFLNFLTDNPIVVQIENFTLKLPHPVDFALHKLIIHHRRKNEEKSIKDRTTAINLLKYLNENGYSSQIHETIQSIPKKWQDKIKKGLDLDELCLVEPS